MANGFKSNFDILSTAFESFIPMVNKSDVNIGSGNKMTSKNLTGQHHACFKCHRVYADAEKLKRHVNNTHNKLKRFECTICDKRFAYKHILQEHQNLHFGLKPHACTECDKRFAARSNLIQHKRRHVNLVTDSTESDQQRPKFDSISCSACTKT
jgi:uncharacterized Zn-finger protein